jgi:hypothetical protein
MNKLELGMLSGVVFALIERPSWSGEEYDAHIDTHGISYSPFCDFNMLEEVFKYVKDKNNQNRTKKKSFWGSLNKYFKIIFQEMFNKE